MKISQIRYFITVAQLENMSRAAELLHISQSSLSKNIAALEAGLGTPLFDRNARQLLLNETGKRFLESCNLILQEYQTAMNDIQLITTGSNSQLEIGCCGSIDRLYSCMAGFKALHPETEFHLDNTIMGKEHQDIDEYDVLIYPMEPQYDKFTSYDFGVERYMLAVPASHKLSKSRALPLKMLEGLDFVFLRYQKSFAEYPYRIFRAMAVEAASLSFVETVDAHRQMIASGIAVGFVSENCVKFYNTKDICLIPLMDHKFSRKLQICFKQDKHLTDFARSFRDYTMEYFSLEENR